MSHPATTLKRGLSARQVTICLPHQPSPIIPIRIIDRLAFLLVVAKEWRWDYALRVTMALYQVLRKALTLLHNGIGLPASRLDESVEKPTLCAARNAANRSSRRAVVAATDVISASISWNGQSDRGAARHTV